MVKIDTIGFAALVSFITARTQEPLYHSLVRDVHELVEQCIVEPEVPPAVTFSCTQVDTLLSYIQGQEKIPAIKAYRAMTNSGLKEAKEAVEKYWYVHDLKTEVFDRSY